MIAENGHAAFRAAGRAALKAILEMARTKGGAPVHEHEAEVGRRVLAALTPVECAKECPFFFLAIHRGKARTGCWLRLAPLFRCYCPLHPFSVGSRRPAAGGSDQQPAAPEPPPTAYSLPPTVPGGAQ